MELQFGKIILENSKYLCCILFLIPSRAQLPLLLFGNIDDFEIYILIISSIARATLRSSIGTVLSRSPRYATVAFNNPDSRENELEICFRYEGQGRVNNLSSLISLYRAGEVFCQVIAVHKKEVSSDLIVVSL